MKQERMTAAEFRESGGKKPTKLHNTKTVINGILFDSKKEAEYELVLVDMKKKNEIIDYFRQVRFLIHEGYYDNGQWVKPIYYVADYMVVNKQSPGFQIEIEIHEVKGHFTRESKNKMKMFKAKYPKYAVKII
jgi:hypothetical protein